MKIECYIVYNKSKNNINHKQTTMFKKHLILSLLDISTINLLRV